MSNAMVAVFVLVWLIGALVGWCAGWAARTEQNRGWHHSVQRQLALVRAQLAEALNQLDDARAEQWGAQRTSAAPTVIQVHLSAAGSWPAHQPVARAAAVFLDELDVLPVLPAQAEEVPS
jgi:hypothetical protein